MKGIGKQIKYAFENFSGVSLLYMILFTAIFMWMICVARKNNAGIVNLFTFILLLLSAALFIVAGFPSYIYLAIIVVIVLIYVILFATEMKRAIYSFGNNKTLDVKHNDNYKIKVTDEKCIESLTKSIQNMSKNRVAALIILANNNFPSTILDSGVRLNSDISSALIESVFFPNTPLHDGAMVICGTQIIAAGCFLPLTQETNIPKDLGTRHRAGIGITETVNVTSIIVSEETGVISIVNGGKIVRYVNSEVLSKTLSDYYWQSKEEL